jgi:hypothetical protein
LFGIETISNNRGTIDEIDVGLDGYIDKILAVVEAQTDEQPRLEEIQDEEDDILTEDLSLLQEENHKFIHQQGKEYRH